MTVLYGPILHSGAVTRAVRSHLEAWLPAYLAEMERQTGRQPRALPAVGRRWRTTTSEFRQWLADEPPAGLVACDGTIEPPVTVGGVYRAAWAVDVAITVKVGGEGDPEEVAGIYGAAIRAAVVQHRSLGGFADELAWLGEDLDVVTATQNRTLGTAVERFRVTTAEVLHRRGGPAEPPADPYAEPAAPPVVEHTQITVNEEP